MFIEFHITLGVLRVNQIELNLTIAYLLMTCYFLTNWLIFSLHHPTSAPENKFLSVVILVTTIFWPVTIFISGFKIFKNKGIDINKLIHIILTIFIFSISY